MFMHGGVLLALAVAALLWAVTRLKGSGVQDPFTLGVASGGVYSSGDDGANPRWSWPF